MIVETNEYGAPIIYDVPFNTNFTYLTGWFSFLFLVRGVRGGPDMRTGVRTRQELLPGHLLWQEEVQERGQEHGHAQRYTGATAL